MSEANRQPGERWSSPAMKARLEKRHSRERRFRVWGVLALGTASATLLFLLWSIGSQGFGALFQTQLQLTFSLEESAFGDLESLGPQDFKNAIIAADYGAIVRNALRAEFSEVRKRSEVRQLQAIASTGARSVLRDRVLEDPSLIGNEISLWVPADDEVDLFVRGRIDVSTDEADRRLKDQQIAWIEVLQAQGQVRTRFNSGFFLSGDSREPELAGVRGALVGSFLTLVVTFLIAFPLGVAAAVYLEEFAQESRLTDIIEININNLAAVPSIVFGLLGLAIFLNMLHLPRSAPLVGGMTLALMTLPTVIIAGRAALDAVPPSIRQAAIGMGASPVQVVAHHVLPLAMPGILTGTIIGMARALGETAPLLMIGMVAFIVDIPGSVTDASTVLPVQVYLWADSPERAFLEKTSGVILVLLAFLILMNGAAVWLRQRFEKQW